MTLSNTLFQQYIIGGGWAMLLLIPASVVAVATALRGMLVISRRPGDFASADVPRLIAPLYWVYVFAPMIGAAATALRLAGVSGKASAGTADLVPLAVGVLLGLGCAFAFFLLSALAGRKAEDEGYSAGGFTASLLILPGFVALAVAFGLCFYASKTGGSGRATGRTSPVLSMKWETGNPKGGDADGTSPGAQKGAKSPTPELFVRADDYAVDGKPLPLTDALFRLTGLAARADSIVVRAGAGVSAARLADALALVNQAGFMQVGVEAEPAAGGNGDGAAGAAKTDRAGDGSADAQTRSPQNHHTQAETAVLRGLPAPL